VYSKPPGGYRFDAPLSFEPLVSVVLFLANAKPLDKSYLAPRGVFSKKTIMLTMRGPSEAPVPLRPGSTPVLPNDRINKVKLHRAGPAAAFSCACTDVLNGAGFGHGFPLGEKNPPPFSRRPWRGTFSLPCRTQAMHAARLSQCLEPGSNLFRLVSFSSRRGHGQLSPSCQAWFRRINPN